MANVPYGSSSGDWRDTIQRAQEQARATEELNQKEEQRRSVEERASQAEQTSSRTRTGLAGATSDLTQRLLTNTDALRAETAALEASVALMERSLGLRRQIAATPIVGAASVRTARGVASGVVAAVEEDPQAASRLASAQRALAEAEIARANALAQVRQTRARPGTTSETLAPVIEQRELAQQQVAVARSDLRAAQANVAAQEALAAEKQQQLQQQQQINAALRAERLAAEREAAAASVAAVEQAAAGSGPRLLGPARSIQLGGAGSTGPGGLDAGFAYGGRPRYRATPYFGTLTGGPSERVALPSDPAEAERLAALRKEATANAQAIAAMGSEQARANQAFQEAGAIYADNSSRLSRHGALTTEFIQSLARGQVTLQEFGEQMTATIGKFGGWVLAGAAVYGVYGAFKDLLSGATETQAAVQQLGRFIPGLGGPAGGGSGQVGVAQATVRNISTQFNVPISQVTDAMGVTARVFHNLSDAADAARAVLAASRLDQVPQAQSTQYLVGISQALGLSHGSQLIGVVNSLNALQSETGARVSQTLPGLARVAPAAQAANVSLPQLEALVGLGVRGGISGTQVGTALLRSISNFAFRPGSQALYAGYGIQAPFGDFGSLIKQVTDLIDSREKAGRPLSGNDLRAFASALGGPSLGGRSILPILEAEQRQPGALQRFTTIAEHPRPYQEDLGAVLGTVSERFKAIGIALQNFGSQLASSGLLQPITGLLDAFVTLTHVIEALTSPVSQTLSVFNQLPGVLRDALGVFIAFRAGSLLLRTQFGGGAQQFLGRLPPPFSALAGQAEQRAAVEGIRGNLQREILPLQQGSAENASRRLYEARGRIDSAYNDYTLFERTNRPSLDLPVDHPDVQRYNAGLTQRSKAIEQAEAGVGPAEADFATAIQRVARTEAQIAFAKNDQFSWAERAAVLEQEGFVALAATVDLTQQYGAALAERVAANRAGSPVGPGAVTPVSGATSREGAVVAGAAVASGAFAELVGNAATALGENPSALANLQSGIQAAGIVPARAEPTLPPAVPAYTPAEVGAGRFGTASIAAATGLARVGVGVGTAIENAGGVIPAAASGIRGAASAVGGALAGPAGPFAALLGTQLIGNTVGGGIGSYISGVGGQAATGAVIAQLLGRGGGLGILAGAGLGAVAGNFSQGTAQGVSSLAGAGAGAAIGGALGTLTDWFTGPAGTIGGAAIGSTVGGFLGKIFGAAPPAPTPRAISASLTQPDFSSQFSEQLTQSVTGTGTSASNAQNWLNRVMADLEAQIEVFGVSSSQGRQAEANLGAAVAAASATYASNPAASEQILQGAQTAIGRVVTRTSALLKYGPGGAAATTTEQAGIQQVGAIRDATQQQLASLQQQAQQEQEQLNAVKGPIGSSATVGPGGRVEIAPTPAQIDRTAIQKQLSQTRANIGNLQATLKYLNALVDDGQEQIADSYLQLTEGLTTARYGSLAALTPDKLAQARDVLTGATKNIATVQTTKGLSTKDRAVQLEQAQQARRSALDAYGQAETAQLQAAGQVSVEAIPSVDIIGRASATVKEQASIYAKMASQRNIFGPTDLASAFAQLESAQQALADAVYQHASDLIQAEGQLGQAEARGDPALQAAAAAQTGARLRSIARTPAQRISAQAQIVQAGVQQQEALIQTASLQGQIASAADYGNTVQQANDAIATANRQLALAQNTPERLQAQLALLQATTQLQQAMVDRYTALGALAASQTVDPVKQLQDQAQAAAKALTVTTGYDNRIKARTNLNTLTHQYESTLIDQRSSIIDFQFQMMQITSQQALNQINDLLHLKGITLAQRQSLLEQYRRYQLGLEQPIGATGFDLAPGNIRLPTYYDVSHGIHSANSSNVTVIAPQINVDVKRAQDVAGVADVIDRATRGQLKAKLKAAGVA